MKKLIYPIMLLLMINLVFALGVERTISNNQVTLKITGYGNRFGGIISETLPTGYSPTGIPTTMLGVGGSASGKQEGQLYEIAFISDNVNPATIVYGIVGSGSGAISGSYAYEDGNTGIVSGQSQLGSQPVCGIFYESICDEQDGCGNTRNTDGTICGTNQECQEGICITLSNTSQQITCYKKGEFGCTSYQVIAASCGTDFATQELCEATKSCPAFVRDFPTKIKLAPDCDTGVTMLILSGVGVLLLFLIFKGVFK